MWLIEDPEHAIIIGGGVCMERIRCVLYDRECIECGECNLCDLDPSKVCDNCKKCIGLAGDLEYRAIKVDGIIDENLDADEYLDDEFQ